jgi:uncharacterized membrane protein
VGKSRIEAFSDGVIAILITIMVLELKVPHEEGLDALRPLLPVFLSYVLSFVYVGIYWNNHHHMFQAVERVNGRVLWANLHLLFWLSLFPFTTGWASETHFTAIAVALYGVNLFMAGLAYWILALSLMNIHPKDSALNKALSSNLKEMLSMVIYAVAIGVAFFQPWVSIGLYTVVALTWLIPDMRFERLMK